MNCLNCEPPATAFVIRKPFLVDDLRFRLDRFFRSRSEFGASEK